MIDIFKGIWKFIVGLFGLVIGIFGVLSVMKSKSEKVDDIRRKADEDIKPLKESLHELEIKAAIEDHKLTELQKNGVKVEKLNDEQVVDFWSKKLKK